MIQIRTATQKDVGLIAKLAEEIWPSAYLSIIGQAQIDYMLEKMYSEAELSKQIAADHIFLIVEQNEKAVGFCGFSLIDTNTQAFKLHKLYVLPETQGTGLGKTLMNKVIALVSKANGKSLILNVNKLNKALSFYQKLGFKIVESVKIDIGGGFFMDDYIVQIKID